MGSSQTLVGHQNRLRFVKAQIAAFHPRVLIISMSNRVPGDKMLLVQAQHNTLRTTCLPAPVLVSVPTHLRTQPLGGVGTVLSLGWSVGLILMHKRWPVKEAIGGGLPVTPRTRRSSFT